MTYRAKNFRDHSSLRRRQARWTKTTKRRGAFVFLMGVLFWLLILSRLFYFQVLKGDQYENIASKQHQRHIKLEANRGLIHDRNGRLLTVNLPVESFFAIPESVKNANQVARAFASSSDAAFRKLKCRLKTGSSFVWLKRKVEKKESQKTKSRLGEGKLKGVWVLNETKRYYLHGKLAEDVLGFTDVDNKGLAGVEFQYDTELSGNDGKLCFKGTVTRIPITSPNTPSSDRRPEKALVSLST